MSNNILNITSFQPRKDEKYLFDTNVLIKIFYPTLGSKKSTPYIQLFDKLIAEKSTMIISSIHISEFINRCIRFQYDLYRDLHSNIKDFKHDYRETDDYRDSMNAILEIVTNDILSVFCKKNDNFQLMNDEYLFLYGFSYDFNDAFISEMSRQENCILITDDADYANFSDNLTIVTNNRNLLLFSSHR